MEETFDEIMYRMLERARGKYSRTAEAAMYRDRMKECKQGIAFLLAEKEQEFINDEYIPAAQEAAKQQEGWIYRQGFLDCVFLLKKLGIIA